MLSRLIVLAAFMAAAPLLRAADAPAPVRPPKIGYVDIVRVLKEYHRSSEFESEATKKRQDAMRKNEGFVSELEHLKTEVERLPMGTPERLEKQRELQELYKKGGEYAQAQFQGLDTMMGTGLREVYTDLATMVQTVAREGDYDFVLQEQNRTVDGKRRDEVMSQVMGRVVLYAKDGYDLTDEVVKRLNAAYDAKKKADAAKDAAAPVPQTDEKRTK